MSNECPNILQSMKQMSVLLMLATGKDKSFTALSQAEFHLDPYILYNVMD